MTDEYARLHAIVHGRVQGVSFRHYTSMRAGELGLDGWVRNRADGTVEVVAEGARAALQTLLAFLHEGPPGARVSSVDATWSAPLGEGSGFGVRW
jgi:acylphosphatase